MREIVGPFAVAEQVGARHLDLDDHHLTAGIDRHQIGAPATVEQLLSFKPGDFVELDLDPMIQAKVSGVPVFDAHYGTSNNRYAIKIDKLLTGSNLGWLGDPHA